MSSLSCVCLLGLSSGGSDFEAFLEGEEEFEDGFDWSDDEEVSPLPTYLRANIIGSLFESVQIQFSEACTYGWLSVLNSG